MRKENIQLFHEYSLNVETRAMYLGSCTDNDGDESGTDYKMAERAIKNLLILDAASDRPITIYLNSPGGDTYHGFAIYDAIRSCTNYVRIIGMGYVMSMGSVILQAGDERLLAPNAKMLLHYGSVNLGGNTKDVINWVETEKKEMRSLEDLYLEKIRVKHPKFSRAALQSKIRHDYILNANEAVELGLAQRVLGND